MSAVNIIGACCWISCSLFCVASPVDIFSLNANICIGNLSRLMKEEPRT